MGFRSRSRRSRSDSRSRSRSRGSGGHSNNRKSYRLSRNQLKEMAKITELSLENDYLREKLEKFEKMKTSDEVIVRFHKSVQTEDFKISRSTSPNLRQQIDEGFRGLQIDKGFKAVEVEGKNPPYASTSYSNDVNTNTGGGMSKQMQIDEVFAPREIETQTEEINHVYMTRSMANTLVNMENGKVAYNKNGFHCQSESQQGRAVGVAEKAQVTQTDETEKLFTRDRRQGLGQGHKTRGDLYGIIGGGEKIQATATAPQKDQQYSIPPPYYNANTNNGFSRERSEDKNQSATATAPQKDQQYRIPPPYYNANTNNANNGFSRERSEVISGRKFGEQQTNTGNFIGIGGMAVNPIYNPYEATRKNTTAGDNGRRVNSDGPIIISTRSLSYKKKDSALAGADVNRQDRARDGNNSQTGGRSGLVNNTLNAENRPKFKKNQNSAETTNTRHGSGSQPKPEETLKEERKNSFFNQYKCSVEGCDEAFPHESQLFFHNRQRHNSNDKKLFCYYCKRNFRVVDRFKDHIKKRLGSYLKGCKKCQKGFLCHQSWKTHNEEHVNQIMNNKY